MILTVQRAMRENRRMAIQNNSSSPSISAHLLAGWNRFFPKPARPQYFDTAAYQKWLEKNGNDLYEHFYSKHADFAGKTILDLGCGYSGKAVAYSKHGPEFICGADLSVPVIQEAQSYLKGLKIPAAFVGADAGALPFADSSFDIVISDDGFDHFKQTRKVIAEICRVLKPGGIAFISFVPYYSRECSHMTEYLRVPWHHVLFSKKVIKQALELVADYDARQETSDLSGHRSAVDGVFHTFVNHLSRLSVKRFTGELKGIKGVRLVRLRKQSRNWARPFTYLPLLNEPFTDGVYCVLKKEEFATIRSVDLVSQKWMDMRQDLSAIFRRIGQIFNKSSRRAGSPSAP
jgi:ubiquinone/menaquinone biosynthesis C-methylase UbiE